MFYSDIRLSVMFYSDIRLSVMFYSDIRLSVMFYSDIRLSVMFYSDIRLSVLFWSVPYIPGRYKFHYFGMYYEFQSLKLWISSGLIVGEEFTEETLW